MPTPLTTPQFFGHYNAAEAALNAAVQEQDPEQKRTLALIGQGYALLAQVDATWLVDRRQ